VADIVNLGVEVQTKGAAQSAQQLGQFTNATKGAARAADTLEDQLRATASAQTQVASTARPMAGAMGSIGQAFKSNSSAIQNASFQLQDIIVQLEMGVPVTRTLGQQLPQLLGGFGGLGAIVGVAAGAFLSFLPMLMSTTADAKTLQETLDDLSDTIGSMRDLSQEMASLEGLADKYGEVDAELVKLLGHMRDQQMLVAQNQAADAVKAIADEYRVASSAVNIFKITGTGAAADVAEELGLTKNAFLALQAGIREAETATTLEDQATAVAKIADVLSRATGANEDLVASAIQTALKLREAAAAGKDLEDLDIASGMNAAASSAAEMARQLGISVELAGRLMAGGYARPAGVVLDPRDPRFNPLAAEAERLRIEAGKTSPFSPSSSTRGATGGAGGASSELQAAARLYESTRTEAERYAAELEKVEALFAVGAINGEVYSRALEDLNAKFDPFTKLMIGVADTIENELNNAFASVLKGTADLGDALLSFASNVLAKVAQDLFAQQFAGPISAGIKGIFSANGNVFDAGGVTAFAKGGVVGGPTVFPFANGIGLMGEAGPEAIMPLSRGADGKLGVIASGGGAPSITINNYSGQEATASSDSAGNIVVEIGRAIAQDITSGGPSYRAIRTTFGLSNRLQQRG
jgi:hypothetical protein